MNLMKQYEDTSKKISRESYRLLISGKFIAVFAIGAMLSRQLFLYAYFIMMASVLLVLAYTQISLVHWHGNQKTPYKTHVIGSLGAMLLVLFFGIQSPQMPYPIYVLLLGVLFGIPALRDILNRSKK
ncbi:MAG: hypothetical protein J4432_00355 [DPANN group archaeon]|nr:hypothetical protein [DPANN group archaeon]